MQELWFNSPMPIMNFFPPPPRCRVAKYINSLTLGSIFLPYKQVVKTFFESGVCFRHSLLLILFVHKSATKLFKVGVEYGAVLCGAYDVTLAPLTWQWTSYFHVIVIALLGFTFLNRKEQVYMEGGKCIPVKSLVLISQSIIYAHG